MNYKRIIIVLSLLSLVSCNTTISRKTAQGEHQQVASASSKNLKKLSVQEHYYVCQSLVKVREFKAFFKCHTGLSHRVAADGGYLQFENNSPLVFSVRKMFYNLPQSEFLLKTLLAEAYLALGQYEKVLENAGRAVALADTHIFQLKHQEEAGSASKAFVSIFGRGDDSKRDETQAWSIPARGILGLAYIAQGDLNKATAIARTILAINTGTLDTRQYDITRRAAAARIYFAARQYENALNAMNDEGSVGLGGTLIDTVSVANIINPFNYLSASLYYGAVSIEDINYIYHFESRFMLYRSLLETGKLQQAKKYYEEALAESRLKNFGQMHYLVLYDRGRISLKQGQTQQAIDYYKRAVDVIEEQRASINIERFKIGFVGDKQEIYQHLIGALIKQGKSSDALVYAERAKARALVDMLAYRKQFRHNNVSIKKNALLKKLERLERLGETRAIQQTRNAIRSADPELASLVTVDSLNAQQIQNNLRKDELLIEYYYHGNNNLYAFIVNRHAIKVTTLNANGLKKEVGRLREAIENNKSIWKKYSVLLSQRLIKPLQSELRNYQRITIVPHGVLHYLPFNILGENSYLIKTHSLRLLPSSSVMSYLKKPITSNKRLLILGNPDLNNTQMDLPGAASEARAIAHNWRGAKIVLRKKASETLLKQIGDQFQFIHMASHGQFNPDAPEKSRMLLAADTQNDGDLTTAEIYDLRLNAQMISLSACQTGLGDVKQGDDVIGLNRGFLYAGAQSIVSSLWSVPDESTRVLMTAFYKKLKITNKADALRQAQIETMKQFTSPVQWAAFQMTGAW